jgi:hypothetical protein
MVIDDLSFLITDEQFDQTFYLESNIVERDLAYLNLILTIENCE